MSLRCALAFTLLATVPALSACSEKAPEAYEDRDASGPHVDVSAAPGVAVNYGYAFRLPVEAIAATQEDHAAACEAAGPARCRIAGMQYHVQRNHTVTARLQVMLAPDIARQYGRQAIDLVGKHGGMLTDATIDSVNAGAAVAGAHADTASRAAQREQVTQQLARPGLKAEERSALQAQLNDLAEADRAGAAQVREASAALAQTPMTLDYESGSVDRSLSEGPIVGAVRDGWDNIVAGSAIIVLMGVTLIPWLTLFGLCALILRRFRKVRAMRADPE